MKESMSKSTKKNRSPRDVKKFLAVDFDHRHLRLAMLDGPAPKVRRVVRADWPDGLDFHDAHAVGTALGDLLSEHKLGRPPVVMCVPRGQGVLKPLHLPYGTQEDEIAGMVRFQVQGEIPFPIDQTVLDYSVEMQTEPVEGQEASGGVDVLAAAVQIETVSWYEQVASAAGVKLIRLGLRPYANAHLAAVCCELDENKHAAIVQLTNEEAEISVLTGEHLVFSRSATVKAPTFESERRLAEFVDDTVSEILRTLQGFTAMSHGEKVSSVFIAGDTGSEDRVLAMLDQLQFERCSRLEPTDEFKIKKVDSASGFVAAIGLGIRSTAGQQQEIDFLNPKQPTVIADPRAARRRMVALLGLLGVLFLGGWGYITVDNAQSRVSALSSRLSEAKAKEKSIKKLTDRIARWDAWQEENVHWVDQLLNLSGLMPDAQQAYLDKFDASRNTIRSVLWTRDNEQVAEAIQQLTEAGYVAQAGKEAIARRAKYGYEHSADLSIKIDPTKAVDIDAVPNVARPEDDDLSRSTRTFGGARSGRRNGGGR